ncbi:hypothetical protein [Burkholderia sp. 22PA0106]|uniref:hypothetical protein n=1 Tax=Burkholderia sp. 22PA0106 TaxID=3237371 RepID=UPI0039C1D8F5
MSNRNSDMPRRVLRGRLVSRLFPHRSFLYAGGPARPAFGPLADRFGRRKVTALSATLMNSGVASTDAMPDQ